MRLKKVFAVFFTFCLIFSVSLQAAFADIYYYDDLSNYYDSVVNRSQTGNIQDGVIDLLESATAGFTNVWGSGQPSDPFGYLEADGFTYLSPIVGSKYAYASSLPGSGEEVGLYPAVSFTPSSAINTDVTWYVGVGGVNTTGMSAYGEGNNWSAATYNTAAFYDNRGTAFNGVTVTKLGEAGLQPPHDSQGNMYPVSVGVTELRVDISRDINNAARQINIWCNDRFYHFYRTSNSVIGFYLPWSFVVPTTPYLDVIDDIYLRLVSIDSQLSGAFPQIFTALNNIVTQLEALNTDTDTIIEILNQIKNLDQQQLSVLNYILTKTESLDTTVKQIYALMLSEVDGSDDLSSEASSATGSINNNDVQEVHWQTSMSYNFDQLQLGNYNLNLLGSGLALVGNMFSSIWSAFGQWSIVFTFPLILGIALLVIGRLSKTGGGNSSRNSEHKGGEGGA